MRVTICFVVLTKTSFMKLALLSIFSLVLFSCGTNRNVYKSSEFDNQAATHHTVAILPFHITQTGHVAKNESVEDIKAANEKWAYAFQESLLTYSLRHTSNNRKGQMVSFQGSQRTNALLTELGLTLDEIYTKRPEEIAKLLGVDAVLMTTLEKDKNFSDGVAYGLKAGQILLNTISKSGTLGSPLGMNASDINLNSSLYNAKDGKLLWKTFRQGGSDLPKNTDDMVEYFSNWIARKLPYRS
jgi:hypothetical protein